MDQLFKQTGYLVLKDDGSVLESSGELQNDERCANIIYELLNLAERYSIYNTNIYDIKGIYCNFNISVFSIDENFIPNSGCERISIAYDDYHYNITMSNRRIYIFKSRKIFELKLNNQTSTHLTDAANTLNAIHSTGTENNSDNDAGIVNRGPLMT